MFERSRPLRHPVTLHFDGRAIEAERGEPLTVSLLAAGEAVLARSPKLHRPRGPSCLRQDCDGCVARVDGAPNVMLCSRFARGGEQVETQNVLGSRKLDLLRVTDWFFPNGIDHHHLLAGVPGAGAVMQTFARQMAGTGRLPDEALAPRPAERRSVDALVVGAGLAGLASAAAIAAHGQRVLVVDEGEAPGGSARGAPDAADALAKLGDAPFERELEATVAGFFEDGMLVATARGALFVEARAVVVASGAHDGQLLCEGNDLPGVLSARALCRLLAYGLSPAVDVALVGEGPWAARAAQALGARAATTFPDADAVTRIRGRSKVSRLETKDGRSAAVGLVAFDVPPAPAFELAQQLGARAERAGGGFPVMTDAQGRAGEKVWAAGECTGLPFDPEALVAAGHAVGEAVARALRG